MSRIILASKSPRRKKLLEQLGLKFEVYPSNIQELSSETETDKIAQHLALEKALDISSKFPDSLIIGADTIVIHEGDILDKPKNEHEAFNHLKRLSNSVHQVITAIAIVKTDKNAGVISKNTFFEQTKVHFSALDTNEIKAYIQSGSPLDKAGAYGIQDDLGALFVEKIEGDYYNVVGLPLNRFYRELKQINPEMVLFSTI